MPGRLRQEAAMKNKYARHSKISEAKIRQIVKLFSLDLTALQIAALSGINRNTANRYLSAFRERIARYCEAESPVRRTECADTPAPQGTGLVFGLIRRDGKVYTQLVSDSVKTALPRLVPGRPLPDDIPRAEGWPGYDGLVDLASQKLFRVMQSREACDGKRPRINGTESFWGFAKGRLARFRGLKKEAAYLHVKECEFRFNHRQEDIYPLMLHLLRTDPLS